MSVDGEERCTALVEIEPIGDMFWCEDLGEQLDPEQVKHGMELEIRKMTDVTDLDVGQLGQQVPRSDHDS
eukprot:1348757-Amphidinium_carterae.3